LLTSSRHGRQPTYWAIAGVCVGVVILPWHLWQYWMHGSLFLQDYVGVNLISRLSQAIERHQEPPWFYLNILRKGFSIWGYLWPLAYLWGVRKAWQHDDRRLWLLLAWITGPLLVFSIAQTKLGWYISMIYPAIALLLALALAELVTARVALGVVAVVMAVCCIRLPVTVNGAPGVREFAAYVAQQTAPGDTIYVFERVCEPHGLSLPDDALLQSGQNVEPSLRFYLPPDRRLRCFEARDLAEGFHLPATYIIVRRKLLPHINHLGQVVFEGDNHTLLRWQRER
jgi:4-amino-4-deoxy-L-arabinose transferase-like glycosyltransferase